MDDKDWRTATVLFAIISSVYFATVAGITSSNDGSHYALVRALVDKRSFEISEYLEFTENQDYALRGDLRFSDRPPGTALLAAPLYAASAILPGPIAPLHSKHDPDNPRVIYAVLLPVIAASTTAIILFWILRAHFGLSQWVSVITTLAFAFGTMQWKYGSLLYSHATSGLMVMGAVAVMLGETNGSTNIQRINEYGSRGLHIRLFVSPFVDRHISVNFWLGFLLGASVLMEYTNFAFAILAVLYWLWQTFSPSPALLGVPARKRLAQLSFFTCGALIPALFLMWYNSANFGSPFALSTFYADTTRWPQNQSFLTDFATPIWVGLPALLFYGSDNQGLFWLAPVSLLGLIGLKGLWFHSPRQFVLIVGVFAAMLLLFSASTTFNPYTNDGRYITPFLALWFVVVGFGLSRMQRFAAPTSSLSSFISPLIIYGLLFLSIHNQIMHIAFSWGHDFDLAALRLLSVAPENIVALWRAVFPNAINLPLWWGMLGVGWVAWRLVKSRMQSAPTSNG